MELNNLKWFSCLLVISLQKVTENVKLIWILTVIQKCVSCSGSLFFKQKKCFFWISFRIELCHSRCAYLCCWKFMGKIKFCYFHTISNIHDFHRIFHANNRHLVWITSTSSMYINCKIDGAGGKAQKCQNHLEMCVYLIF